MTIPDFEITSPAAIHCGAGSLSTLAAEAARFGTRAALVTGRHLLGSEALTGLIEAMREAHVPPVVCPPVTGEPTVETVDDLARLVRGCKAEVVLAIGGGSVLDAAKAAAVMATNPGKTADYQLKRRTISNAPIPQVAAPTTAGTGSEATRVSVLTNEEIGVKRSISHPLMTPSAIALDPELTVSVDRLLTTTTAMDAFAHSIESAVCRNANPYTVAMALAAIEQLADGLPRCQADPNDLDARLACLLGSCFAGLSMQAGLGASHSLAPAVCIAGKISHSAAVGSLLPYAVELNERMKPGTYNRVKQAMGCTNVAARLTKLCAAGGFTPSLAGLGLGWDEVFEVMKRYASHRQTNPVDVTDAFARELFEMSASEDSV